MNSGKVSGFSTVALSWSAAASTQVKQLITAWSSSKPSSCDCEKYNHHELEKVRKASGQSQLEFWQGQNRSLLARTINAGGTAEDLRQVFNQHVSQKFIQAAHISKLKSRYLGNETEIAELLQEAIANLNCSKDISLIAFWLAIEDELLKLGLIDPQDKIPLCPHEIRDWFKDEANLAKIAKITSLTLTRPVTIVPPLFAFLTGLTELHIKDINGDLEFPKIVTKKPPPLLRDIYIERFTGEKIKGLGQFSASITYLKISDVNGFLFDCAFSKLTKLEIERFQGSQMAGIDCATFPALTDLKITSSQLTILPFSIYRLAGLQKLQVTDCRLLREIPNGMGALTQLQELDLSKNAICTFSPEGNLNKLVKLTRFDCSDNPLREFSLNISGMCSLTHLKLSKLQLSAVNIELFTGNTSLIEIDLSENMLAELPDHLPRFVALEVLKLKENKLTVFPQTVCYLRNLVEIDLTNNRLAGQVPEDLKYLRKLKKLFLDGNPGLDQVQSGIDKTKLSSFTFPHDMVEYNEILDFEQGKLGEEKEPVYFNEPWSLSQSYISNFVAMGSTVIGGANQLLNQTGFYGWLKRLYMPQDDSQVH